MNPLTLQAPAAVAPRRRARHGGWSWLAVANGAALMVVAVLLRVDHLGNIPGVNGDEAWSGVQALRLLHGESIVWWTPTGNPINVFYFLPLVALHAVAPPSFELLRMVSLASGLAALVTNYFLCRRAFDTRTAVVSTWLLAVLPIDIAYSRFAWDASQSLLATLCVMYLPLIYCCRQGSAASVPTKAMLAMAAAVWVHPTNLFAAPLLVVPLLYRSRRQLATVLENTHVRPTTWTLAALVATSAAVVYVAWRGLATVAARVPGPGELGRFAENYLQLFSGTTVYEFISGINSPEAQASWFAYLPLLCNVLLGCVALGGLLGMYRRLSQRPTDGDESLVLGWFVMVVGFFLVAGSRAVTAHYERYGICLIAPGALVVSRGLGWWLEERPPRAALTAISLSVAAWALLLSFHWGYFQFIERTGGCSHLTFRTAAVEPKLQAFRSVLAGRRGTEPVRIVCSEWWNYWPLAYLALGQENVQVLTWDAWQSDTPPAEEYSTRGVENTWFVEFAGTRAAVEVRRRVEAAGLKVQSKTIYDYGHRELLTILGPAEKFPQNY